MILRNKNGDDKRTTSKLLNTLTMQNPEYISATTSPESQEHQGNASLYMKAVKQVRSLIRIEAVSLVIRSKSSVDH